MDVIRIVFRQMIRFLNIEIFSSFSLEFILRYSRPGRVSNYQTSNSQLPLINPGVRCAPRCGHECYFYTFTRNKCLKLLIIPSKWFPIVFQIMYSSLKDMYRMYKTKILLIVFVITIYILCLEYRHDQLKSILSKIVQVLVMIYCLSMIWHLKHYRVLRLNNVTK